MSRKVLVLGAGFSKSVAGLPVTTEMFDRFKSVMKEQERLGHNNRVSWGKSIFQFVDDLEEEYLKKPYERASNGGKILKSNYLENFEGLCSLIDLNLAFEVHALSESKGEEADFSGKPLFLNEPIPDLKMIRGCIGTYLYLSMINDNANKELLELFYSNFFSDIQSVVTFNYDLILEKFLYDKKLWFPRDGYGFQTSNLPEIQPAFKELESSLIVYKLHGSLNWNVDRYFHDGVKFEWFDDDTNHFFPGYLADEKKREFTYEGGVSSGAWLFPSWIKQFEYDELIQVWRKASQALRDASEIHFIGYSLPRADSAVHALLSAIDFKNKKIVLVDPNAEELISNYSKILRVTDIEIFSQSLEEYLQ